MQINTTHTLYTHTHTMSYTGEGHTYTQERETHTHTHTHMQCHIHKRETHTYNVIHTNTYPLHYAVRRMICIPDAVETTSLISPTSNANL